VGTVLVRRPARIAAPAVEPGEVTIADPPRPQPAPPAAMGAAMLAMPVLAGGGGLVLAVTTRSPLAAATGGLFLVAAAAVGGLLLVSQRSGPRRQLREARERYLDYLEDLRGRLRRSGTAQQAAAGWRHPEPVRLPGLARDPARRWERRAGDEDFLVVRVGVGERPAAVRVAMRASDDPLPDFDPVCLESAKALRDRYRTVSEQPACLDLARLGVLSVVGDRAAGRALARALLAQLVTFHAPPEVRIGLVRSGRRAGHWEWAKWLPHHQHPTRTDGPLPARLVAGSLAGLAELLEPWLVAGPGEPGRPGRQPEQLVVVVDGEDLPGRWEPPEPGESLAELGIHLVFLVGDRREEPERVGARLTVAAAGAARQEWDGARFRVDAPPDGLLPALARLLAPFRIASEPAAGPAGPAGGSRALGGPAAGPPPLSPEPAWQPRPLRERLRVPIGTGADGRPVLLDLKESAHGGMGPHGLVVGATGSGKSELLRSLLAALVLGHPPDQLALLLVDFKGGATFAPMAGLPHLAGLVTNLEDSTGLVDRMHDALFGELRRRQELLRAAGNLPDVGAYQRLREAGARLVPLPHLLVVVDEFSELLAARPDFAELFVAIGRIGRSIGVHLLLATQRLETGRIRGLESHLSYRIGLRTFSEAESREVLGVPDAHHLPPVPGSGYLKVDTTVFARFRAALVSAPPPEPAAPAGAAAPVMPFLATNGLGGQLAGRAAGAPATGPAADRAAARSILELAVQRVRAAGAQPVRPVWLDPLPEVLPLDRVQDPRAAGGTDSLRATLGLVDDPGGQRQYPLEWDFLGAAGNLLVVGAPRSGKSTLLGTLICSMALRYPPGEVAFYCVDHGGGALAPLARLPAVAGVATRLDPERVARTVSDVEHAVDLRERLFRELRLATPAALRAARTAGQVPASVPGAVFLVIDGWAVFREEFELLADRVGEIAARGAHHGVHVVLTVTQPAQLRIRLQPCFPGRVELRLSDRFDSAFDRELQQRIGPQTPGRGVSDGDRLFQAAVPRIDGRASGQDLAAAQEALVATVVRRWPHERVRPVRMLPRHYPYQQLPTGSGGSPGVPVGICDPDLQPAEVDLSASDPHLLVYGDGESGKTNLLRVLLRGFQRRYRPEQLGIVLVDHRRGLLGAVRDDYLLGYCAAPDQAAAVIRELAASIGQRRPGPAITPAQLRERSWWSGLVVLVVVDDYDLLPAGAGNPLLPLVDLLAQARDLGLHLVLSRRTGGAARAALDPVLQRLNDLATPGFLFSGDRLEGPLAGGVSSQRLPAGRALQAGRGGCRQVQVAWLPPPA
jgi:S-DNA-T family DNA segregation ATPase FtsK/SpoIIIE